MKCIVSEEESDGNDNDTVTDNDLDTDNKPIQPKLPTKEIYIIVTGAVNDVQTSFMLDSGASMVCVPEELVKDDQWLPKTTRVRLGNADRATLGMAKVRIRLGNWDKLTEAIVMNRGGRALYPVNFRSKEDVQFATNLAEQEQTLYATTRLKTGSIKRQNYEDQDLSDYGLPQLFDTDNDRDVTYTSPDIIELGTNFVRENGVRVWRDELNASVEGDEYSEQAELEGISSLGVEQDKEDNNDCQLTFPQFRQVHSNSDLVKDTLQDGTLTSDI